MRTKIKLSFAVFVVLVCFGCAAGPQVVYITDAQEVTVKALEPVQLADSELRAEIAKLGAAKLPLEKTDVIMNMISEQIARTKRFTVENVNMSSGKTYIIEPHIDELPEPGIINIPTDPTRKKVVFKARVRLDVLSMESDGTKLKHISFNDQRVNEERISIKNLPLDAAQKADFLYETIEVAFKAAANKLGAAFNPSYVFGTITKISGKQAHININTTKIAKLPNMKRKLEVIDSKDNNLVLATIEGLKVDNGTVSGTIYEKSSGSITEGTKVRIQVNDLQN